MKVLFPQTDLDRYALLEQIHIAGNDDHRAGNHYLYPAYRSQLDVFLPTYRAHLDRLNQWQGQYHNAVAQQKQAFERLKTYVRDFRTVLFRQIKRQGLKEEVLVFYQLPTSSVPFAKGRISQWLQRAERIVEGEAGALGAGFPPMANPSVADVEREWRDLTDKYQRVLHARRVLDDQQNAMLEPRQEADHLIRQASQQLTMALSKLPADDIRHIKRRYGFTYIGREEGE